MGPSYLKGKSWDEITREERVFCAELWTTIRDDPERFVTLLGKEANIDVPRQKWEAAYEVCFYRDFFHPNAEKKSHYPRKRTFDLVMFGEKSVIVIEAKAAQRFSTSQGASVAEDKKLLKRVLAKWNVTPHFVALATAKYFNERVTPARRKALAPFAGHHLTWEAIRCEYGNTSLLLRASEVYEF